MFVPIPSCIHPIFWFSSRQKLCSRCLQPVTVEGFAVQNLLWVFLFCLLRMCCSLERFELGTLL